MIIFPDSYTGLGSLPDQIQYTIQSQEYFLLILSFKITTDALFILKYLFQRAGNLQYNIGQNFYEKNYYLYGNSPQYYCFSNKKREKILIDDEKMANYFFLLQKRQTIHDPLHDRI
jgi:hypothetical protein